MAVDDLSARSRQTLDLIVLPDRQNAVLDGRNGLGTRPGSVHGQHFGVHDHQVGLLKHILMTSPGAYLACGRSQTNSRKGMAGRPSP